MNNQNIGLPLVSLFTLKSSRQATLFTQILQSNR